MSLRPSSISGALKQFFDDTVENVREINRKYAVPRIRMTKPVRFTLIVLRLYLVILLCIMLFKFIILVRP